MIGKKKKMKQQQLQQTSHQAHKSISRLAE